MQQDRHSHHGKSIAVGTKEQLTGMIKTGEKVTIEGVVLTSEQLAQIRQIPHVFQVDYKDDILTVHCTEAKNNLGKNIALSGGAGDSFWKKEYILNCLHLMMYFLRSRENSFGIRRIL